MGSAPTVLLIDDGELDDVARLLADLHVSLVRVAGHELHEAARLPPAPRVVVATGRRALALDALPLAPEAPEPTFVAVVTGGSRTVRMALRRVGFHYLVHRPVHPDALRLLFARLLYRGPEKRSAERVAVGAPISFRGGLRRRDATLIELSLTGCRLLAAAAPARRTHVTLHLPDPEGRRTLSVRARVVRVTASERGPAAREIAFAFEPAPDALRSRIERLVVLHLDGPAAWVGAPLPGAGPTTGRHDPRRHRRSLYQKRVIALSDAGARVVLGRDLSIGGMRLEAGPRLEHGELLSVALHGAPLDAPLVVRARVVRRGVSRESVLRFIELDAVAREALGKLVADGPEIESLGPQSGVSRRTVVTTVERLAAEQVDR
jgi:hypothetical protein